METLQGSGAGRPGRHSRDFFGISGPKGPKDLCKGRVGSQPGSVDGRGDASPKESFKAIFRSNLTRLKITSEAKNNLKRLFLALF